MAVGAMATSSELRRPCSAMRSRSGAQRGSVVVDAPEVGLEAPGGGVGLGVAGVGAVGGGQRRSWRRGRRGRSPRLIRADSASASGAVERQAEGEEHVLEAHHAEAHGAPALVGPAGGLGRVEVPVDHPVEEPDRRCARRGRARSQSRSPPAVGHEAAEVDRAEVAHRGVVVGR